MGGPTAYVRFYSRDTEKEYYLFGFKVDYDGDPQALGGSLARDLIEGRDFWPENPDAVASYLFYQESVRSEFHRFSPSVIIPEIDDHYGADYEYKIRFEWEFAEPATIQIDSEWEEQVGEYIDDTEFIEGWGPGSPEEFLERFPSEGDQRPMQDLIKALVGRS